MAIRGLFCFLGGKHIVLTARQKGPVMCARAGIFWGAVMCARGGVSDLTPIYIPGAKPDPTFVPWGGRRPASWLIGAGGGTWRTMAGVGGGGVNLRSAVVHREC